MARLGMMAAASLSATVPQMNFQAIHTSDFIMSVAMLRCWETETAPAATKHTFNASKAGFSTMVVYVCESNSGEQYFFDNTSTMIGSKAFASPSGCRSGVFSSDTIDSIEDATMLHIINESIFSAPCCNRCKGMRMHVNNGELSRFSAVGVVRASNRNSLHEESTRSLDGFLVFAKMGSITDAINVRRTRSTSFDQSSPIDIISSLLTRYAIPCKQSTATRTGMTDCAHSLLC
mmetsp:Transcript_8614/g.24770  ORF Transcript_8614/g.24770 Transcript_8614/m.24770 type:complete len:233 (+) Transcript_8614:1414-2112(+)